MQVLAKLIRDIAIVIKGKDVFPVRVPIPGMDSAECREHLTTARPRQRSLKSSSRSTRMSALALNGLQ